MELLDGQLIDCVSYWSDARRGRQRLNATFLWIISSATILKLGDKVSPLAFPDIAIELSELFQATH